MEETTFSDKCQILADLWLNYRDDEEFQDYIQYNDLGLPLAYAISNEIVEETPLARGFVEEAFSLLLSGLDIEKDYGFDTLDAILEFEE